MMHELILTELEVEFLRALLAADFNVPIRLVKPAASLLDKLAALEASHANAPT